jgi:hypothetical protein
MDALEGQTASLHILKGKIVKILNRISDTTWFSLAFSQLLADKKFISGLLNVLLNGKV